MIMLNDLNIVGVDDFVKDFIDQNFMVDVVELFKEVLVFVDFWVFWCGLC